MSDEGKYRTKVCPRYIVIIESGGVNPDSTRSFYDHADTFAEMKGYVEAAVHDGNTRAHIFERTTVVRRPCDTVWNGPLEEAAKNFVEEA